ncbi:MAG: tetratricopeptide repeat protein, partial [Burkholderiales bacterium]
MTAFVAICAVLLAAAIGLLVWPLLRPSRDAGSAPRASVAATLVAAALPVAAFAIYFWASNWDWQAPETQQAVSAPDLQRVAAELQNRLAKQPDDVEGWKLLGRSATVLGDYALARSAFGEAYTRTDGRDAEAVVGYAESRVLIDEREIDGEAAALFERALELAPDNARALWYGGIVAYRRGDMRLAQRRWVELQQHDLPQDLRQVLGERLAELELSQGQPTSTVGVSPSSPAIEVTVRV